MASKSRTRERDLADRSGGGSKTSVYDFYYKGSVLTSNVSSTPTADYPPGHEYNSDKVTITGPYRPQSLTITKRFGVPASLSGSIDTGPIVTGARYITKYQGYYGPRNGSMWNTGISTYQLEDPNYWLSEFLARTNPIKPVHNIPLFLWELQEFPQLLRHYGDILSGRGSGSPSDVWLAFNFGWKPLFSDLVTLLTFAEKSERHLGKLVNAKSQGREARVLHRNRTSSTVVSSFEFEGTRHRIHDARNLKVWATGHWVLNDPYRVAEIQQLLSSAEGRVSYARARMGLRVNYATIWNMIPWSWVVDYLGNIGNILENADNNIGVSLKDVSIMISDLAKETSEPIFVPKGLSYRPHQFFRVRKTRQTYSEPTPLFSARPILTWAQLGNLGALVTAGRIRARY